MKENEMTIGELANYAAAEIAYGWEIVVSISCGSGTVDLYDVAGNRVELCADDDLETQVKEAVSYSREHSNP